MTANTNNAAIRCPADVLDKARKFRSQMPALGAVWILLGVLIAGGGGWVLFQSESPSSLISRIILSAVLLGFLWACAGLAVCLRSLSGLRYGLILHYVLIVTLQAGLVNYIFIWMHAKGRMNGALELGLITGNCLQGLVIGLMLIALAQGHRLLTWSRELQSFGISPTTPVEQLVETNWKVRVDWQ